MYSPNFPQCLECTHLIREPKWPLRCAAFPQEIPEELYTSFVLHNQPYPGDRGIMWEKYTGNLNLDGEVSPNTLDK
jgi:hypothetical protein